MERRLEKFQTNSLVTFFKLYLLYTFNRFSDHTRNNIFKRIIHILWTHIIKGCKCNFLYLQKKNPDRSPVIQEIHVFWLVVGYRKWTDSGGKAGRDGKFLCSGQFWHVSHTTQITHWSWITFRSTLVWLWASWYPTKTFLSENKKSFIISMTVISFKTKFSLKILHYTHSHLR